MNAARATRATDSFGRLKGLYVAGARVLKAAGVYGSGFSFAAGNMLSVVGSGVYAFAGQLTGPGTVQIAATPDSVLAFAPSNHLYQQLTKTTRAAARLGYGLRLLNSAYSGACVRVRRGDNNATQDIGFVNGAFDLASYAAFVGTSATNYVSIWYNQFGGNNATQVTNANQPQLAVVGGEVEVRFNGAQWFDTGYPIAQLTQGGADGSVFLLVKPSVAYQFAFGVDGPSRWASHLNWVDGNVYFDPGMVSTARVNYNNAAQTGVWGQYSMIREASRSTLRRNRIQQAQNVNASGACSQATNFWIGGASNGSTGKFTGALREFIMLNTGLATATAGENELGLIEQNQLLYQALYPRLNTYSGGTVIYSGVVRAQAQDAFGTGPITVYPGATLDRNGFTLPNVITNQGSVI